MGARWKYLTLELRSDDGGNAWYIEPSSRHYAGLDNDLNGESTFEDRHQFLNILGNGGWEAYAVRYQQAVPGRRDAEAEVYYLKKLIG